MQRLGHTRSAWQADHALFTPDTFIRAPLPGMKNATAIVHAAPVIGAAFTEYTVEFAVGGSVGPAIHQRFIYVLDGKVSIAAGRKKHELAKDGYAYLPAGGKWVITAAESARAMVIEKPYQVVSGERVPQELFGNEGTITGQAFLGDEGLTVRSLLPSDFGFDFAVNTMTFVPGASLPMVEIHVMEHGILMLEGGGIYRLNEAWYPTTAGDFIWIGPYCPQWFGALGKVPAKYLIYKDWNRQPRW